MNERGDGTFKMGGKKYELKKWDTVYSAEEAKECLESAHSIWDAYDLGWDSFFAELKIPSLPAPKLSSGENATACDPSVYACGISPVLFEYRKLKWELKVVAVIRQLPAEFRSYKLAERLHLQQGCFDRSIDAIHRYCHRREQLI